MNDIRIATALFNAPLGQVDSNLKRMESLIKEASHKGAALICFPEMALTGYCSDSNIFEHSLTENHESLKDLKSLADHLDITILAGLAEKDDMGRVFASHFVFIPGKPPGKYRKIHIAPPEKSVFTAGDTLSVFEVRGFRFGIQLCYDAHFPFLSTLMAEKGVDALFIPHASPRGTAEDKFISWMRHIPARSFDNGIFVIVCNQCGENGNGLAFPGLAFVTDPSGMVISRDISNRQGLLFTDLTQESLLHVRNHRMRYFLPNRRKDLII